MDSNGAVRSPKIFLIFTENFWTNLLQIIYFLFNFAVRIGTDKNEKPKLGFLRESFQKRETFFFFQT